MKTAHMGNKDPAHHMQVIDGIRSASTRWSTLDGLRGMIAVTVLVGHVQYSWLPGSFIFMDTFFMMSGFLITRILVRQWQQNGKINLLEFYRRRFRRLAPALLLVVAFVGLCSALIGRTSPNPGLHLLAAIFYFENWLRALAIPHDGILGHTWSLAIEEQFYLVWPLLLIAGLSIGPAPRNLANSTGTPSALHSTRWIVFLSAVVILCMAWRTHLALRGVPIERLYNGTDMRLDSLGLGALLALTFHTRHVRAISNWLASGWASTAVLALLWWAAFNVDFRWHIWYAWIQPICTLLSLALLAGLLAMPPTTYLFKLFSHPAIRYVGTISYGFYLWHYPLIDLSRELLQLQPVGVLLISASLTLLLASISYHFLELPLLGGKRNSAR
ncbi:acyltransferase family protein [Xylophilus sp. ASV27]|uniref:acyltransferase family protein n=1 Tax=Xylophilus sp. ASV27 TaxID=2795129 RepID=UPI0018EDFA89|nr:acyltransferase [Xylophilus sp. ASV27]